MGERARPSPIRVPEVNALKGYGESFTYSAGTPKEPAETRGTSPPEKMNGGHQGTITPRRLSEQTRVRARPRKKIFKNSC